MADKAQKWKTYLHELWDGREVYVVDGEYVRDHFYADFAEGTNGEAYDYCPKKEIWVEQGQKLVDLLDALCHQILESTLLKYKVIDEYEASHDAAQELSVAVRKISRYARGDRSASKASLYPKQEATPAPAGEQSKPLSKLLS